MEKLNKILFAFLGTLMISAIDIPGGNDKRPDFNSDIALSLFNNEENYVLPVRLTKYSSTSYKLVFSIYNAVSNAKVYTKTYKGTEIGTHLPVQFDIDVPIKNRLKTDGLRLEFVHSLRSQEYESQSAVIYPYQKQNINITAYRKEPLICHGNYLLIKEYKTYSDETFDFSNLNDYLSVSSNNKLDLTNIVFKYSAGGDFRAENITLNIRDYNNVFPNLKKNDNVISLKMKYRQIEDDVYLELDEEMYVNSISLDMSNNPMANYVLTDSFFIPANKEDEFLGDELYISMFNCGYSQNDYMLPFNFYFSKKYVGECYESDYCIHGGIKE